MQIIFQDCRRNQLRQNHIIFAAAIIDIKRNTVPAISLQRPGNNIAVICPIRFKNMDSPLIDQLFKSLRLQSHLLICQTGNTPFSGKIHKYRLAAPDQLADFFRFINLPNHILLHKTHTSQTTVRKTGMAKIFFKISIQRPGRGKIR